MIGCNHGALRLLRPISGDAGITITSVAGRVIERKKVTGFNMMSIQIGNLDPGIYYVKISSIAGSFCQRVLVTGAK